DQLEDAIDQLGAELGMFVSTRQADGEYRILAASDMAWSTVLGAARYERARTRLMQQGYIPLQMEENILVQVMDTGSMRVLEDSACNREVTPFLPEGHPPIRNLLLVPIRGADGVLGLLVLANRGRGFETNEQIIARAYADAAALLMYSDLREVERLSALETARVKEELFRNLNHELRTPLNTINGMGRKLAETSLDATQEHALKQITKATQRLTHLVEQVFLLAGLDTGEKVNIDTAPFRPPALLTSIAAEFDARAKERGIELSCSWDEDLPPRFNGDSDKIALILQQLVGNAIKFSRDAEVRLTLEDITNAPGLGHAGTDVHTLRFAVTDHGIGIAAPQHELIFEPFYQCDTSRSREYEGAGLGLSVARKLARILGSEIKLESEVGAGSTFYFDLDLTPGRSEQNGGMRTADAPSVAEGRGPEEQLEEGDEAQLLELLRSLEEPLLHSRPRPCNAISAKLRAKSWPAWLEPEVDKVISFMDKYRYPEALDHLHRLQIQVEEYLETDA
ncbi:MAG: GAF domain-containing sensor histidine kinase, partial [Geobacteraceae bacterium]|nr:GAF domain-containing sensor histidine kinase [Geobacteraceae bacterium]